MPSFDPETVAAWEAQFIEEALAARKPTEHQLARLQTKAIEEEANVARLAARLAKSRALLQRIHRKLRRGA
jgi:hypothetical protein